MNLPILHTKDYTETIIFLLPYFVPVIRNGSFHAKHDLSARFIAFVSCLLFLCLTFKQRGRAIHGLSSKDARYHLLIQPCGTTDRRQIQLFFRQARFSDDSACHRHSRDKKDNNCLLSTKGNLNINLKTRLNTVCMLHIAARERCAIRGHTYVLPFAGPIFGVLHDSQPNRSFHTSKSYTYDIHNRY